MSLGSTLATERPKKTKARQKLANDAIAHPHGIPVLSPQQWRVAELVEQGLSNKEIAPLVGIQESSLKVYLHKMYIRVGVSSRLQLAVWYRAQKNISPILSPVRLTGRMKEVADLVRAGCGSKEIGKTLGISPGTVKIYITRILAATNCKRSVELSKYRFIEAAPDAGGKPRYLFPLDYLKALVASAAVIGS